MPTDEQTPVTSQVEVADDPKADSTSEDDPTQSQEDITTDDASQAEESPHEEQDDADAMVPLSKLKEVRREARSLRERLRTAESRIAELEANDTSAIETKANSLLTTLRTERLDRAVSDLAAKSGALEPNALAKLISADDVEWTDDKPTNVESIISKLRADYPRLFGSFSANGNAGTRDQRSNEENLSPQHRLAAALANTK